MDRDVMPFAEGDEVRFAVRATERKWMDVVDVDVSGAAARHAAAMKVAREHLASGGGWNRCPLACVACDIDATDLVAIALGGRELGGFEQGDLTGRGEPSAFAAVANDGGELVPRRW